MATTIDCKLCTAVKRTDDPMEIHTCDPSRVIPINTARNLARETTGGGVIVEKSGVQHEVNVDGAGNPTATEVI